MRRPLAACLTLLGMLGAGCALADEKRRLEAIKNERAAVERRLTEKENEKKEAARRLASAERAMAAIERRLEKIAKRRAIVERELAQQERRRLELERKSSEGRVRLAQALGASPPFSPRPPFIPLLGLGKDSETARREAEAALLYAAVAERLEGLDRARDEAQATEARIRQARDELERLAHAEQAERRALENERAKRREALALVEREVENTRATLANLRAMEARLARLIARLSRSAKPARPPLASKEPPAPAEATVRPPSARERGAQPMLVPVRGEVVGRYGAPRPEGTRWKGLFYRAEEGAPVRAAAAGVVVFADWLRGYGHVAIIDHGDALMSVYGHAQTLRVSLGQKVGRGETIATAGNTGAFAETGLYFEIRHRGQAVNPKEWLGE
ncbi:MAG: peptidoglycan DD-metalloendopeptidase family protein [Rhodocyclaceae bacterium]|nr:peptidoglycan DD-metalloendopeptidase family protein [Rhodocyclaceae bacterium]